MASCCSRARAIINRSSLPSIKSALRSNVPKSSLAGSPPMPSSSRSPLSSASPLRRLSFSRTPCELGCMASMLPLHSAVATARMTSCLSTTSRSCRSLSQGTLCCTSPGL
ncbi:protein NONRESPONDING TO OXYLIPINS 2, mitochondrial-like isoform X2 [Tripterygium wilfordii]|uniref:protein NONRESPONDING TO OXYLIPINS 2, mitochondrial-like isoform X2 n=1 Tax=Tripterygium wilfordii TaxID=458696 RepID=UPI0018F83A36|nr:protein NONRESPONDING TO OXYLIPINS 2, mitochondrial-like isoform X2 [Tripterygium wilfordii]XP_038687224.1 protein NONRESPONDING TO OXYLIPINS 2, mitochondrial-like isoform X2 [Tripterygium wilfordii]